MSSDAASEWARGHHVGTLHCTADPVCASGDCGNPRHEEEGCPTIPVTICRECSAAANAPVWPCAEGTAPPPTPLPPAGAAWAQSVTMTDSITTAEAFGADPTDPGSQP